MLTISNALHVSINVIIKMPKMNAKYIYFIYFVNKLTFKLELEKPNL